VGGYHSPIIGKSALSTFNRSVILPILAFFAILLAIQTTRKRRSYTIDHLIYAEQPSLLEKSMFLTLKQSLSRNWSIIEL
jgi:hypothetical protein